MNTLLSRCAIASLVVLASCSPDKTSATSEASDAAIEEASRDANGDAVDDAAPDAGAFVDQPADVYPASHHPLPLVNDFGGLVLLGPKVVTVTFAGDAWRDDLRTWSDAALASAWWTAVASEYAVGAGVNGGDVELPDTVSGKTLDQANDLEPMLNQLITAGSLPAPDANTLYVVYFPAATTLVEQGRESCSAFEGFHGSLELAHMAADGTSEVPYAAIARCTTSEDDVTFAASHEILEAATDPSPTMPAFALEDNDAWTASFGGEVADLCEARTAVTAANHLVTRGWSNAAARASKDPCVPADANEIYFNAAIDTETIEVEANGGTHSSDGYVTATRGSTRVVRIDVFSDAALPSDLMLSLGVPSSNGASLGKFGSGIDATLSRTVVRNGSAIALSFVVASTAEPGEQLFVVEALGSSTNYHSWPAILRIE